MKGTDESGSQHKKARPGAKKDALRRNSAKQNGHTNARLAAAAARRLAFRAEAAPPKSRNGAKQNGVKRNGAKQNGHASAPLGAAAPQEFVVAAEAAPPPSVFAERRKRIEACKLAPDVETMALALCAFDESTDPDELTRAGQSATGDAIVRFTQFLIHRTMERAAWAQQGREFEPSPDNEAIQAIAKRVEAVFRGALLRAFPPVAGTTVFPVRKFERTFAAFVGGDLRLGRLMKKEEAQEERDKDPLDNHGVPDGANYFCFAEAVLMFLRLDIEAAFWRPLLRTFVCGAQFFAASYWGRKKRDWQGYANHPNPEVPCEVVLAALDQRHAAMDPTQLARLFSDVVAVSLKDAELPRPALVAKELQ